MGIIDKNAAAALMGGAEWRGGNTRVELHNWQGTGPRCAVLYLHGNIIARHEIEGGELHICSAGWESQTTRSRLNALPGVRLVQRAGAQILNGVAWDGYWTRIPY